MQVISRTSVWYSLALAAILGFGIGAIAESAVPHAWPIGVLTFILVAATGLRGPLRRWRAVRRPLPRAVRAWIDTWFPWMSRLDRTRFEQDVKIVLDEWHFEGVDGIAVSDDMRAGVAAGAALLLHGRPDWELPRRQTVLFYPDRFDLDYLTNERAEFDGMAHQQGPIILSARAVEESWADPTDGNNVVLHELAHLLDYENEFADGIPSLIHPGSTVAWRDLVRKETRRVRLGRSMLRRYAATNHAEFFAVAVENFFERPELMRERHKRLFEALEALFRFNPVSDEVSSAE